MLGIASLKYYQCIPKPKGTCDTYPPLYKLESDSEHSSHPKIVLNIPKARPTKNSYGCHTGTRTNPRPQRSSSQDPPSERCTLPGIFNNFVFYLIPPFTFSYSL